MLNLFRRKKPAGAETSDESGMLVGDWCAEYTANGRFLRIEYSFLTSGTGVEKISGSDDSDIIEMHRFFWSLDDSVLKLVYISENMSEVRMRCAVSRRGVCILSDVGTGSEELYLQKQADGQNPVVESAYGAIR